MAGVVPKTNNAPELTEALLLVPSPELRAGHVLLDVFVGPVPPYSAIGLNQPFRAGSKEA